MANINAGDVTDAGIEMVREVEGGEGEFILLGKLSEPRDIQVGETVGSPLVVKDVEYLLFVEADFETDEMQAAMTGKDRITESIVAVSNENAEAGIAVMVDEDVADIDELIVRFESEELEVHTGETFTDEE